MKRYLILILFFSSVAGASTLELVVPPVIDLKATGMNHDGDGLLQKNSFTVENFGSVPCDARVRVDFYNNMSRLVWTSWSSEMNLQPGKSRRLDSVVVLPAGNYSADAHIYRCSWIEPSLNYTVSLKDTKPRNFSLEIHSLKTKKDYVAITVSSNVSLENLAVVPVGYPLGWIFESSFVDSLEAGKKAKIKIGYEPSVWKNSEVEFAFATLDGKFMAKKKLVLERKETFFDRLLELLGFD